MAADTKSIFAQCPLPRSLEIVGERWSFLILIGAFNRLAHFEQFQSELGIARNILSNRLASLVENEILYRQPDPVDRRKVAYRLTKKGKELLPVLIGLRQWGEKWVACAPSNPVLVDRRDRLPVAPMQVQAADGRALALNELEWVDAAEIGSSPRAADAA